SSSADTAPCEIYTLSLHDALPILNILHHEKLQLLCRLGKGFIIGPAVSRICAQNPQSLDLSGIDALDDLVVGDGRFLCQHLLRHMKHLGDPCPARRVSKVPAAIKYRGIAERAGAHGVTLSCDGVGSGTRFTDVAGHQRQIDDCLGGPHRLIALIDAHGPPEGYPLSAVD